MYKHIDRKATEFGADTHSSLLFIKEKPIIFKVFQTFMFREGKLLLRTLKTRLSIEYFRNIEVIGKIVTACMIILIFVIALGIRLFPLKWGYWLSGYDPYFQYRVTEYIVNNGFQSWFSWYDEFSWYPYGRNIPRTSYPGVPFTGAFFYLLAQALGIEASIMQVCAVLPALLGALSAVITYLTGREIGGETTGIFSGLFLATIPAFITRTSAGFYDTESVGFFAMTLSLYFWVKAMKSTSTIFTTISAALSGASLAYMLISWGGGIYLLNLYALYALVMIILGKYSRKLLITYALTMGVGLTLAGQIQYFAHKYLVSFGTMLPMLTIVVLSIKDVLEADLDVKLKAISLTTILGVIGLGIYIFEAKGYLKALTGRILAVINPFIKEAQPLVASVAEHRAPTWAYMFLDYQILIILAPIGVYLAFKRGKENEILMAVGGLAAIYFASSMIRLIMLAAPLFSILGALSLVSILKPHIDIIMRKEARTTRRRKMIFRRGRGGSAWILIITTLILMITVTSWRAIAYSPPTIVSCGGVPGGTKYQDWIEALLWMRVNLPDNAVVASWWDYGYWITTLGNKTSICDNATLNGTQIKNVAIAFMSNETIALEIFKKMGVTHVVVFETFDPQTGFLLHGRGYGDFAKSYWMIRIAGFNASDYIKTYRERGIQVPGGPKASNATLYRLLFSTRREVWKTFGIDIPEPENFELVFQSSNGFIFIYEIKYPES
ncbi:MAG: hypothetical protein NDF54_02550 [archaeon GB-1867-035]|nr:hypothetical protein [Candidatus Culexmicrobium profundum]